MASYDERVSFDRLVLADHLLIHSKNARVMTTFFFFFFATHELFYFRGCVNRLTWELMSKKRRGYTQTHTYTLIRKNLYEESRVLYLRRNL